MRTQNYYAFEEIKEYAIEQLRNDVGLNDHASDLHHFMFNEDYYIIGTFQAKQWIKDEAFDIIEIIKEYEQDNFGEVNTDFSDPEKVVNMYVYIVGEMILNESDTLRNAWNKILSQDDVNSIIEELETL